MMNLEQALYDALLNGDLGKIADMRSAAMMEDPSRPLDAPDDWEPPVAAFERVLAAATARYQADHEAAEEDRITAARRLAESETVGVSQTLDAMTDAERARLGLEVTDG